MTFTFHSHKFIFPLFSLDMTALMAGAMYRGQFEERLKAVLKAIKESEGKIILLPDLPLEKFVCRSGSNS